MFKKRINHETCKEEIKIQPEGLPAIWIEAKDSLCEKCKPYGKCMDYRNLSDKEWQELKKN